MVRNVNKEGTSSGMQGPETAEYERALQAARHLTTGGKAARGSRVVAWCWRRASSRPELLVGTSERVRASDSWGEWEVGNGMRARKSIRRGNFGLQHCCH